jgi:cephalosporin hydroxylase
MVFTVDIEDEVDDVVKQHPLIRFYRSDSALPAVTKEIKKLRALHPGPVFAILDSNHSKAHVLAEMELLRGVLVTGDYLVVEDSNINGHPVMSGWGPGPWEAVAEYFQRYPDDYRLDSETEGKFGFTCAPRGYLERKA